MRYPGYAHTYDRKSAGYFFDRKTLVAHYAVSSKPIDDNREDLASLRLLGSDPLVSVQIEMRSLQNLATNKTTFCRVRCEVLSSFPYF
jgi:hypothetical protein